MATTTTRKKSATTAKKSDIPEQVAPEVENETIPVENETSADAEENDAIEAADVEAEEEMSLLDQRMAEIPADLPDFPRMMAERIVQQVVRHEEAEKVIVANTISPENVAQFANDSDIPEIVEKRNALQEVDDRLKKLQAEIDNLRAKSGQMVDDLHAAAREVMEAQQDQDAKADAISDQRDAEEKVKTYLGSFKIEIPGWEDNHTIKEWVIRVNTSVFGNGYKRPTNAAYPSRSPEVAAWNERCRQWARNNGLNVSARGRIANAIKLQYAAATGDRPPHGA